ncbi:sialate O-acetylesterase [Stakelama pacifica]|uniref:Sialate O-acetylesterase n=1 Tax=Stakelama pacifica TaxID=517720 RepID=A0A4R6FU45_9SPHN|nr:sialate O-acetylesterase [Stakelama pacifica]TDN84454.1 sialate O-acetylesterase [Stakelama pacifica]
MVRRFHAFTIFALGSVATMAIGVPATDARPQTEPAAPQQISVRFANIFADHAVLQRDRPIRIWGSAAPEEIVTVRLNNAIANARTDRDGHWQVSLPAMEAGGPYMLTAMADGVTSRISDVMIGDVYLCSGQSNMEFPAKLSTGAWGGLEQAPRPDLRFAIIPNRSEATAQSDLAKRADWQVVGPASVGEASAVCYYMASALQKRLGIPVGFVSADWGGTTIQSWISTTALSNLDKYREGERIVALMATDPTAARKAEQARRDRWWNANIPSARAHLAWAAPGFDDSGWPTVVPKSGWTRWGQPDLAGFNGVLWYRTSVDLTAEQAAAGQKIELGPIDTVDDVWVNGQWVGGGGVEWMWRSYALPGALLREGRNTIAVRALSRGKEGGMTGLPDNRGIRLTDDTLVPLGPGWRYQRGASVPSDLKPLTPPPWEPPQSLSTLYNGMIAPIAGYGFRLAAWYQGESNAGEAGEYATLLPMLMADWRKQFDSPDLPFLIVQLSSFGKPTATPEQSGWAELRDVQAKVARADPHAALATSIDHGDPGDVHPPQKKVVGERLARAARAIVYGENVTPSGPYAADIRRDGDDLMVRFADSDGGMQSYSGNVATGFQACDIGNDCRYVAGTVEGDSVRLSGANRPGVVKLRYGWSDAPFLNLFGKNGLPAIPFERAID